MELKKIWVLIFIPLFMAVISATGYAVGETTVIFAKVTVAGKPISNAQCNARIFNSNQFQVDSFELTYVNNSRGLYSKNFIVPNETGVYIADVICVEPINESFQTHYFSGEGIHLSFKNSTQNTSGQISIEASDFLECYPDRFGIAYSDFVNKEFEDYRFVTHIDNANIWVKKDLGVAKEWTVALWFYKVTDCGEIPLGAVSYTSNIGTTPIEINLNSIDIDAYWSDLDLLEVAFCAKSPADSEREISFLFGNITDSKFVLHTSSIDATTDFEVGGSLKINVVSADEIDDEIAYISNPQIISEVKIEVKELFKKYGIPLLIFFILALFIYFDLRNHQAKRIAKEVKKILGVHKK